MTKGRQRSPWRRRQHHPPERAHLGCPSLPHDARPFSSPPPTKKGGEHHKHLDSSNANGSHLSLPPFLGSRTFYADRDHAASSATRVEGRKSPSKRAKRRKKEPTCPHQPDSYTSEHWLTSLESIFSSSSDWSTPPPLSGRFPRVFSPPPPPLELPALATGV